MQAQYCLRPRVFSEFCLVIFEDGGTQVEADIWLLEAEPNKHTVVVVSRIRVSWYLKVTYRWNRSVRYCFDRTPALPQFHLHLDGVLGDILIDTTGDDDFIFRHADMAAAALQEWGSPDVNIQERAGCTAFV